MDNIDNENILTPSSFNKAEEPTKLEIATILATTQEGDVDE